jgi:hypothetical protein
MKRGVHETRHENLHGWRKIAKTFRGANNRLVVSQCPYGGFWLVEPFMMETMKGSWERRDKPAERKE